MRMVCQVSLPLDQVDFLPGHWLAVAGNYVHLGLHRNGPPIHQIGVGRRLAGLEEVMESFAYLRHDISR